MTFQAPVSGDHPDPIAELTTDGPARLHGVDAVDTGGPGTVWQPLGESLAPGQYVSVDISCAASPADVSYTIALYDELSTPFTISGAVTNCASCSPTNDIDFSAPGSAHYVAAVTIAQGAVDLSSGNGREQVFSSSGSFDLGYVQAGRQDILLTPLFGPTAKWSVSIHALPVTLSGLTFEDAYIAPSQRSLISYHVDGSVTLNATIENASGAVVRTLASHLFVAGGDELLAWDGLNASGLPVPDGKYTVAVSYVDPAGHSGSAAASVEVDGTPPVLTPHSSKRMPSSGKLVIDVHDALSGLADAILYVGDVDVESLNGSGSRFVYAPRDGWSPGRHRWRVEAVDKVGNTSDASGTFETTGPACRVPRLIGRTPDQARAAIVTHRCSVGRISRAGSRPGLRGHVIAQRPHAGRLLRKHSHVSFTVGLGGRS